jgi:hypothetical protein
MLGGAWALLIGEGHLGAYQNPRESHRYPRWPFIVVTASWFLLGLTSMYLGTALPPSVRLERSGVLGDSFGAVSSLFAGLALVGVYYMFKF